MAPTAFFLSCVAFTFLIFPVASVSSREASGILAGSGSTLDGTDDLTSVDLVVRRKATAADYSYTQSSPLRAVVSGSTTAILPEVRNLVRRGRKEFSLEMKTPSGPNPRPSCPGPCGVSGFALSPIALYFSPSSTSRCIRLITTRKLNCACYFACGRYLWFKYCYYICDGTLILIGGSGSNWSCNIRGFHIPTYPGLSKCPSQPKVLCSSC